MPVVRLVVAVDQAELAADALWQAGPSAVGEEAGPDGTVVLTADVAHVDAVDGSWPLTILDLVDDASLDAWRAWATPVRAGERIVLHPAWLPLDAVNGEDVVVLLDPGRTFGSGSHVSTRLVVAAIETHLRVGDRVLDVGTGSGVLAVVAARLGATTVRAIDVDPASPSVTRANAARNAVGEIVAASTEPLDSIDERYDLVLANIGVRVLGERAGDLWGRVRPAGLLVLAGLLAEQVDGLLTGSYPQAAEVERTSADGWTAVVLRRPDARG